MRTRGEPISEIQPTDAELGRAIRELWEDVGQGERLALIRTKEGGCYCAFLLPDGTSEMRSGDFRDVLHHLLPRRVP